MRYACSGPKGITKHFRGMNINVQIEFFFFSFTFRDITRGNLRTDLHKTQQQTLFYVLTCRVRAFRDYCKIGSTSVPSNRRYIFYNVFVGGV